MAGIVMGQKVSAALGNGGQAAKDAIHEILKYYSVKPQELPESLRDLNEQLEYLMRPSGIMRRTVILEKGWYKDAVGAMLGTRTDDGSVVALIPTGLSGYSFLDASTGKRVKLNKKNEGLISEEAICFYKPLPLKKLGMQINKTQNNTDLTVALEGRLDTTTAPQLEAELKRNLGGITSLTLDLAGLEYLSSAGLRVILSAQKVMNRQGKMVVKNANDTIMEIFEVTGFSDILNLE